MANGTWMPPALLMPMSSRQAHVLPRVESSVIEVPSTLVLTTVAPKGSIYSARSGHASAEIDGRVYVFGGQDINRRLCNDLYELNTATGEWSVVVPRSPLPSPRYFHSLTPVPSRPSLLLFGGFTDNRCLQNDCWVFCTARQIWMELRMTGELPNPRAVHSLVAYKEHLYLFGGIEPDNQHTRPHAGCPVWRLELNNCRWERVVTPLRAARANHPQPPYLDRRYAHHSAVYGDWMYITGGFQAIVGRETERINDMWRYSLLANTWEQLTGALPTDLLLHRCASVAAGVCWTFIGGGSCVHAFNLSLHVWRKMPIAHNISLPDLCRHSVVLAPIRSRHNSLTFSVIVTGGKSNGSAVNDALCLSSVSHPQFCSRGNRQCRAYSAPMAVTSEVLEDISKLIAYRDASQHEDCSLEQGSIATEADFAAAAAGLGSDTSAVKEILQQLEMLRIDKTKLESQNELLKKGNDRWKCSVCYDRDVEVMFAPCHHMQWCMTCVEILVQASNGSTVSCPVCRAAVSRIVRPFLPS